MSYLSRLFLFLTFWCVTYANVHAASAQEYMDSARAYLDAGQTQKAIIEAKNALQADPESGEVRLFLGEVYLRLGQGGAAEKEFRFARRAGLTPDRVLEPLGKAYLMQGNYQAVLDEIRPLLGDDPAFEGALQILRARAYLLARKPEDAAEALQRAASLLPQSADLKAAEALLALAEKRTQDIAPLVEQALALDPAHADSLAMKADLLRQQAKLDEALRLYEKALESDPYHRESLLGKATVQIGMNRLAEAEETLAYLDTFAPGMLHRQYLNGVIAFHRKDFDKVQEVLAPILQIAPGYAQTQLLAGVTSYAKNEVEAASSHLSDYLEANPGNVQARKLLAMLKVKQGNPEAAVRLLQAVSDSVTDDAQFLALLGGAYLEAGDASSAMSYLEKAAELAPDAASIQSQMGLGYLALGETDQAVSRLENAVRMDPALLQADMMLVQIHLRKREYGKAIEVATKMLEGQPENPLPYNVMAAAYLGLKETAKARQALEKAIQIDPEFRPAHINLARIAAQAGDFAAARKHYESVLQLPTRRTQAYLGLAELESKQGNREKAVEWLVRAQDEDPEALRPGVMLAVHYLSINDPLKALPIARSLVDAHPDNPLAWETLGNVQMRNKDMGNAIASFEKLSRLLPQQDAVWVRLGQMYMQEKSYDSARAAFEEALALNAENLTAIIGLGAVELESGNAEAAAEVAERVTTEHPDFALGFQLAGDIRRSAEDHMGAAIAYGRSFDMEPTSKRAELTYRMYRAAGNIPAAIAVLEKWISTNPADARIQLALATEYQAANRSQDAVRAYELVRELAPQSHVAWNNLAWIYHESNDPRALEYARKARDLAPQTPEVLDTYGWIELLKGDANAGMVAIQEAAVFGPHIPTIQYHLAVAQEKNGRGEAARKTLKRLIKSGKPFPELDEAKALLERLGG